MAGLTGNLNKKHMPAVSVIIPVYNVEPYMARCARSLFGQTLKDIEFLFIDDCSPDRSIAIMREVLEEYPERKEQVTVYRMPNNSGQAAVRMQGIKLATAEYLIHCDSDDYIDITTYERMYNKAKSEDLDIVTCNVAVERDGVVTEVVNGECTSVARMLQGYEKWNLYCRLTRKDLLEDIFPPIANMGEDMVISVQTQLKAKSNGHIEAPLYYYCFRFDSITNEAGNDALLARWKSLIKNANLLLDILVKYYGYSGDEPEIIHYKYRTGRTMIRPLVHIPKYRSLWKETFPEVDKRILFLHSISLEEKIWFILIHLRLYYPVKCITGWIRGRHYHQKQMPDQVNQ